MKRIAVFCSSSEKLDSDHIDTAHELGRQCAKNGVTIVHGGSGTGLMKHLTTSVNANGGKVEGVMCKSLVEGRTMPKDFAAWHVSSTYMKRIALILERAEAIVALPGGLGTLHEVLTALVLRQVGEWEGRIVLANPRGYWGCLISLLGLHWGDKSKLYESDSGPINCQGLHIAGGCDPIRLGAEIFALATGIPPAVMPWDTGEAEASMEAHEPESPATG